MTARVLVGVLGVVVTGLALGHIVLLDTCLTARLGLLGGLLLIAVAAKTEASP